MAKITHKGKPIHTKGHLPKVGKKAPDFLLTGQDLNDFRLANFAGKIKILNIVPSLDTGTCAKSARRFDQEIAALKDTVVLTISRDLPFAQARFCKSENITSVIALSCLRDAKFGRDYGVAILDGVMAGLLSRSIVVLDKSDRVVYTEQVPEISQEPDYERAIQAVQSIA